MNPPPDDPREPLASAPLHLPTARTMAEECGWTLRELAAFYAQGASKELAAIEAAAEAGDFETLTRLAHGAKGSGAACGAVGVAPLYAQLEQAASGRDAEAVPGLLEAVRTTIEAIVQAFERA